MKRFDRSNRPAGARRAPILGPPAEERTLVIGEVGGRGDGQADGADGPIYAPFTLPGETVRVRVIGDRAEVLERLIGSPERVEPPCRHFGRCGGCQLQHWRADAYLAWKQEQVRLALHRRGVAAPIDPIIPAFGVGRRRVALHGARAGKSIKLGFVERGGARIGALEECPVMAPALVEAVAGLRALVARFGPSKGAVTLACLWTQAGLDVDVKGAGKVGGLDRAALEAGAALARQYDWARLSFDGEAFITLRAPVLVMGAARVVPPPGAFVQATAAAEEALGRLVMAGLEGASRAVDLFSGVGTFALRMAGAMEVLAVEGDEAMLSALKQAADGVGGLRGVSTVRRDLLRQPFSALELKRYDAVVFDPPRAGAKLQAEQIARSKAEKVVAVSCDPGTFARDLKILVDAGFRLVRVSPVDQFRFSPHVEVVGALVR
jgi:23S rRNA (uracil1939-C5)-methyltransferase